MKDGTIAFLNLYFDLHSFSGFDERSHETMNSEKWSTNSPSNIHEFRIALSGWYTYV